jgi:WD40 repeat protein
MSNTIDPSRQSELVQEFLYACAFWIVAADEELKPGEQTWLNSQFGKQRNDELLIQFSALEGDRFFQVLDDLARAVDDSAKRSIYPGLISWLQSCCGQDGDMGNAETDVLVELKKRLSLDTEIRRLTTVVSSEEDTPTQDERAETRILRGHTGEVYDVSFSPAGATFASASEDATLKLWNAVSLEEIRTLADHSNGVMRLKHSPDGNRLYSGDRSGKINMWNATDGSLLASHTLKRQGGVTSMAIAPDGKMLVVGTEVGRVILLDADSLTESRTLTLQHSGVIRSLCLSMNGKTIVTGGDDKIVRTWNVQTGSVEKELDGHEDGVLTLCATADGKRVLSGARDNTVKLWDLAEGKAIRTFVGHSFSVYGVDLSRDGKLGVSGSWDHTVRLWSIESGQQLVVYEDYSSRFNTVAFDADATLIIAASSAGTIHCLR